MMRAPDFVRGLAVAVLVLASSCATKTYEYQEVGAVDFRSRAQTQTTSQFKVTVAVPGAEESEAILGLPVYDRKIQPIWVEVHNKTNERVRYAPVGTDRYYFAPLEVAYMHLKRYKKEYRLEIEERMYDLSMERQIPAGETRSGFVFTNLDPGTKGFNIDLFGAGGGDHSFTFFVDVPGYTPDHSEVDFDGIYPAGRVATLDMAGLRTALRDLDCCTTDSTGGGEGMPINVVFVGEGEDVLHSLLRGGWYETVPPQGDTTLGKAQFLEGRPADATFRLQRARTGDRNELHVWLAPLRLGDTPVWYGQVTHYIGHSTELGRALFDPRLDPDMDDGRNYFLQNMWYSQGLAKSGWVEGAERVPVESARTAFSGTSFFTDGYLSVLWLSSEPVSLLETESVGWADPFTD